MESKERVSFKKDKVQTHTTGPSGITATSKKHSYPTSPLVSHIDENGELVHTSEIDFDKLAEKLNLFQESPEKKSENIFSEENDDVENHESNLFSDDGLDDLSEEEVIKNLNQHLGYSPEIVDLCLRFDENGNVLPQRVIQPEINPYKKRESIVTENIVVPGQPPSSHPIAMPAQNPFLTTPPSAKDTFCRSCGSKYLATDNFCGGCGFKRI